MLLDKSEHGKQDCSSGNLLHGGIASNETTP